MPSTDSPTPWLPPGEGWRCWRRRDRRRVAQAPARHAEWVVLLTLVGELRYAIDGQLHRLARGSLLFAPPGVAHYLIGERPDSDLFVAVIDPALLGEPPAHPPATGPEAPRGPRRLARTALDPLESDALGLLDAPPAVALDGLRWWLHRAWTAWSAAPPGDGSRPHPAIERALALLRADSRHTVAVLADTLGLSPNYLSHLFAREVGVSLRHYRAECRLDAVRCALDANPRQGLLQAALAAGYADYSAFYRDCRRLRAASPRSVFGAG